MYFPVQVHFSEYSEINKNEHENWQRFTSTKPNGLWTSTLNPTFGTDWVRACYELKMYHYSIQPFCRPYIITPKESARILTITDDNFNEFDSAFGTGRWDWDNRPTFDWERVADLYDVVRLKDYRLIGGLGLRFKLLAKLRCNRIGETLWEGVQVC